MYGRTNYAKLHLIILKTVILCVLHWKNSSAAAAGANRVEKLLIMILRGEKTITTIDHCVFVRPVLHLFCTGCVTKHNSLNFSFVFQGCAVHKQTQVREAEYTLTDENLIQLTTSTLPNNIEEEKRGRLVEVGGGGG